MLPALYRGIWGPCVRLWILRHQSLQFGNHCSGPERRFSDKKEVTSIDPIIF